VWGKLGVNKKEKVHLTNEPYFKKTIMVCFTGLYILVKELFCSVLRDGVFTDDTCWQNAYLSS
jgi:hypothetical protein